MLTNEQKARATRIRAAMDVGVSKIKDDVAAVNEAADMLRVWKPGEHAVDAVRLHAGVPYRCVQAHDSTTNPDWTPDKVPALWMQYHGTSPETARGWVAPTGEHDRYLTGEYMIWQDGKVWRCERDTSFSPADEPEAWRKV